ncbi:MocR-like pyridoxine biosynthesis transcription factor PdxR [Dendrosporobacter sp. 1207_IL3150]|uniref:MocR-like pyridoxine biosynthesis transcription factor PdxR n=1 Tax=Dendrosporobacter sp. 1207_IL3150 TaxID=3084054 RepID=UPI002FDB3D00
MDITKILTSFKIDPKSTLPMYLQIANCLAAKIIDLHIPSGTKLPPERILSQTLGVSRTTAINAYKLLEDRSLVSTKIGSGTYVTAAGSSPSPSIPWEQLFIPQYNSPLSSLLRTMVASPTAENAISLAAGMPDPALYPLDIIESAFKRSNYQLNAADFGHIHTEGYQPLRHSLSKWLVKTGVPSRPDNLLIVSGSQQGLYLIVKTFIEPRDYIVVESPTYLGAIQAFESAGARVLCLPQTNGYDLSMLEDYLVRYRPKLFYTIPTFQNPTGRVASLRERQDLIRLASRHRLVIIEDDPYSQLYYNQQPPPTLKALDTYGGVIYLGTFSKILFPGLRIGWVNAPHSVINRLAQEKQYIDLHSNNIAQTFLNTFLEEDYLPGHLNTVRTEYKKRRDTMANALKRYCGDYVNFELSEGGFYLWCTIAPPASPTELLRQSTAAGVSFVPGEAFYTNGAISREIRLCFATHNESRLAEGIRLLGRILASGCTGTPSASPSTGLPII